ncbi:MAG: hypothetical protein ABEI57_07260 [Halapricum sp.]
MLRCECGGALSLEDASGGPQSFLETYRCASCGRTGTYRAGAEGDETTGVVTRG